MDTEGQEKEAAKEGLYYSVSYSEKEDKVIVKVVNAKEEAHSLRLRLDGMFAAREHYHAKTLTAAKNNMAEATKNDVTEASTGIAEARDTGVSIKTEDTGSAETSEASENTASAYPLPESATVTDPSGTLAGEIILPAKSFTVLKF